MVSIFLSLLIFLTCCNVVTSEVHYITPSRCPEETSCLTLTLLAESTTNYLDSDTTLIFLQGDHILKSELSVKNISKISITSINHSSRVTIKCEYYGRMTFDSVGDIYITNMDYIKCRGHQIRLVDQFILKDCIFLNHTETAVEFINSSASIINTSFITNSVGNLGAAISTIRSDITIEESTFEGNSAEAGGVILVKLNGNITIVNSTFMDNHVTSSSSLDCLGGVVFAVNDSNLAVFSSVFQSNLAQCSGQNAKGVGVLAVTKGNLTIQQSIFAHNEAARGVIFTQTSNIAISDSTFRNNVGGVLHLDTRSSVRTDDVILKNNTAHKLGIIYLVESTGVFAGSTEVSDNVGCLLMYYSNVTFRDDTNFASNKVNATTISYQGGGTITAIRSNIIFGGRANLAHSRGENGGAIHAIASNLYVYGNTIVSNNTAVYSGGGIYLFLGELICDGNSALDLLGNDAEFGGGVHAISSIVTVVHGSEIRVIENVAKMAGGGIYLEVSARLNILIVHEHAAKLSKESHDEHSVLTFIGNSADLGGAVYVADETNSGTCNVTDSEVYPTASECFLQTIILGSGIQESDVMFSSVSVKFINNHAQTRGLNVFGGLLDRCTLSPFTNRNRISRHHEGFKYFTSLSNINISDLTSISSGPVRICFCNGSHEPNCSYQPPSFSVKKGETFTVLLATVDQANYSISAKVRSFLSSGEDGIVGKGEQIHNTSNTCTSLNFSVMSPQDHEELIVYADGPCKDAKLSQGRIQIKFSPCTCPIGFQQKVADQTRCVCECDSKLTRYVPITNCSQQAKTIVRGSNSWIGYVNTSGNVSSYVIHHHCPLNYCKPSESMTPINLSILNGSDVQCALHRSGVLCGACQSGFSLSIGSSYCMTCPSYWPSLFIATLILVLLAGIALAMLLLVLNLTVAVGTLNGIIFYANIVAANSDTFFTFPRPNFATVFISWLNLDFGLNICFIKNLDAYWKTWLQLAFPAYVIFLVVMVIIISQHSKKFSQLIGMKNPVATLATLIFLSYAKLLNTVIASLSCTTLTYSEPSDESHKMSLVWLSDATVGCLRGKHIILFMAAIVILLAGITYTVLLFSWQWLLYLHDKLFGTWVRNLKLSMFIETHHLPYTPRNRYWTGLLLLVRVILYIASAANVSNDPKIDLLVIGAAMISILLFKEVIGVRSRVYKKWPIEILEASCYLNLILLCVGTFFALESENVKAAITCTSVSITFVLFLGVLFYHMFTEIIAKAKLWMVIKKHLLVVMMQQDSNRSMEDTNITEIHRHSKHTSNSSVTEEPEQLTSLLESGEVFYTYKECDSAYNCELRETLL